MIRINLYPGGQKPKKGKRAAATVAADGGGNPFLLVILLSVVIVLAAAAGNGFWYWKLQREAARIQVDTQRAEVEYRRLSQIKARCDEREKQKADFKKRVDVIDTLRDKQTGPVKLLAMLGSNVNRVEDVWLDRMTEEANDINLKGIALSVHGVADLMRNLQNSGQFKAVEIKSSYQDESVKDMQAFIFELVCQKPTAQTPASQPSQPPKKS